MPSRPPPFFRFHRCIHAHVRTIVETQLNDRATLCTALSLLIDRVTFIVTEEQREIERREVTCFDLATQVTEQGANFELRKISTNKNRFRD